MPTPYTDYYIWPPRTKSKIPFADGPVLNMWRRYPDAIAQFKLNGTRNLIKVKPDRTIEFWNRHNERQSYVVPVSMREQLLELSPAGHYTVWDTELMHFKTKDVKNVLYFYDCLVWESKHLIGLTYQERYDILRESQILSMSGPIPLDPKEINRHIYLAQNIPVSEWDHAWAAAKTCDHVEGLVLKRLGGSSRLSYGAVENNNGGFMCRIRKFNKNLLF